MTGRVGWSLKFGMVVNRFRMTSPAESSRLCWPILGAVMLVLLIVCVNVTNLLLALGARRRGEFAMRAALGAGRMRMIRQLLTESLLLAALGGALGMVVAEFGVRRWWRSVPSGLPRVSAIAVDGAVFAFGLASPRSSAWWWG
jgi:putative ABC transport system permease protein